MRITVDTSHDSHEDIKKVINMLKNLVGDSEEIFTNQPELTQEASASPFANIFGDTASSQPIETASETTQETQAEETSESTEDLFAELFSEEELKKMDTNDVKEKEEEEIKPAKGKKYSIDFY